MMKKLFLAAGIAVMFWNLENFFDYRDGGSGAADTEFSARGSRHWTSKRFFRKCDAVAKTILWASGEAGELPDIVAVAEIENRWVLRKLITSTALEKLDYKIVHYDSPDPRGIDVGLLYNARTLKLISSKPCHVTEISTRALLGRNDKKGPVLSDHKALGRKDNEEGHRNDNKALGRNDNNVLGRNDEEGPDQNDIDGLARNDKAAGESTPDTFKTRDILLAEFERADSSGKFAILVNHHPSKYGGETVSGPRREAAVMRLAGLVDSLSAEGYAEIIACGDFNDTPDNPMYERIPLTNLAKPLHDKGEGTIRYEGRWELIDMFFVSDSLAEKSEMHILRAPFLMKRDRTWYGEKPFRTYSGPRYDGGVSDHCPILLRIP